MRKIARIVGLVWLALLAIAGAVLWATETSVWAAPLGSDRALIYLVFAAALPGVLLYRWGRGAYQRPVATRALVAKAYPAKTAGEMGHVAQVDPHL